MTDLRTAAQQALEALESDPVALNAINNACAFLRAALAEPQEPDSPERRCGGPGCDGTCCKPVQEPVAVLLEYENGERELRFKNNGWDAKETPLYTAPPRPAQAAQEPVAIADGTFNHDCPIGTLLYASPQPQQTEPSQDTPPQHEYEVTANDDGTFSVGLPDGEELRIIPPQRPVEPVAFVNAANLQGLTLGLYGYAEIYTSQSAGTVPLYTAPPQRSATV